MKIIKSFAIYTLLVSFANAYSSSESAFRGVSRHGNHRLESQGIVEQPQGFPKPSETYKKEVIPPAPKHDAREVAHETRQAASHKIAPAVAHHNEHEPPLHPAHAEHGEAKHEEAAHGHEHGEAAHGHEHGEAGHGHEHGESEESEHEASSLAVFLMGGVASLMVVFYLVNHSNKRIKDATWNVLNMTASIFVAVLLFGTVKAMLLKIFEPSVPQRIALTLVMFVCCFLGLHALLFKLKESSKLNLQTGATLLSHITGFAGMYGFCDSAELKFIEEKDVHGIVLLIFVSAAIIITLIVVMSKVMRKVALADGTMDEKEEEWIDTCEETDDDVFCLSVSFLLTLLLRFLIRGELLPYEPGHVGAITQSEATQMLVCGLFFGVLVGGGAAVVAKHGASITSPNAKRAVTGVQHLNSMTMAWCLLFWAEWQLYVWGWERAVIAGCLVVAVSMTIFSFGVVIVTNYAMDSIRNSGKLAKRAGKSIELALGILVGFSWERAFDVGFEELEHTIAHRAGGEHNAEILLLGLSALLVAIVAPAWQWHILPKTMQSSDESAQESSR